MSQKNHGVVLIMALLFLVLMTLFAVVSMRTSTMSEKMISNRKNESIAFQSAESALKAGENRLKISSSIPVPCSQSPCDVWATGTLPDLSVQSYSWWNINGVAYTQRIFNIYDTPKYTVEQLAFIPDSLSTESWASGKGVYYYRITSYSLGLDNSTSVITQSTYSARYN